MKRMWILAGRLVSLICFFEKENDANIHSNLDGSSTLPADPWLRVASRRVLGLVTGMGKMRGEIPCSHISIVNLPRLTCFLTVTKWHSRVWVGSWCLLESKLEGRFLIPCAFDRCYGRCFTFNFCHISLLISCSTLSIVTTVIFCDEIPLCSGTIYRRRVVIALLLFIYLCFCKKELSFLYSLLFFSFSF